MLDSILEALMQLKTFILVSAIGIVIVGIFLLIYCRKFSFTGKNLKTMGFFYNLSVWDTVGLACCYMKTFLIFSILLTSGRVDFIHIIIFCVLDICYIVHRRSFKGVLLDVVLSVVSIVVLNIMNMLYHYLNEILYDVKIVVVVWLLGILLCLYSIYDLMHCVKTVVEKREG